MTQLVHVSFVVLKYFSLLRVHAKGRIGADKIINCGRLKLD